MGKFLIIVEGCADAVFINDYLQTLLPLGTPRFEDLSKFQKGHSILICNIPEIKLFIAGGCTHVKKYKTKIKEYQDQNYKILMIQDADNPVKDKSHGGVVKRMSYLDKIRSEFDIDFQTFLFPDNKNDGDLEEILLSIANQEMYQPFFNCYKSYSDCLSGFADQVNIEEIMQAKYLVYNYCQVYQGVDLSNEKRRTYVSNYWNLEHDELKPLRAFLISEISLAVE